MTLAITLQPELEMRNREEAAREVLTIVQLATRKLLEAELLWRIRTAAPDSETRQLHKLLRRNKAGLLSETDRLRLLSLLDAREEQGARRLQDLIQLLQLRAIPVRELMNQLGIRPVLAP